MTVKKAKTDVYKRQHQTLVVLPRNLVNDFGFASPYCGKFHKFGNKVTGRYLKITRMRPPPYPSKQRNIKK